MYRKLTTRLRALANKQKAAFFPNFFKTGKGQYGEGDIFIGVTVPQIRSVVKECHDMPLSDVEKLINDPIHEFRLAGFLILVWKFQHGMEKEKKTIANFYLAHTKKANNWDLVDASAPGILGAFLFANKDTAILDRLARSKNLWEQRIAIVSTLYFIIKDKELRPTMRIATMLLDHPHDLIHKAVGWMLREAGKKDEKALRKFLDAHASTMPRTALRYALEKFDEPTRKRYMRMRSL